MILTDAGPLVALIDADERAHQACVEALDSAGLPMITTWPAFTEAMYLLHRAGGWRAQAMLWRLVQQGHLTIDDLDAAAVGRAADLMELYADRPMDLADATLVAVAERDRIRQIFTLDRDFGMYRRGRSGTFDLLPVPGSY